MLCAWAAVALAQSPPPLVRILSDELDGNFSVLSAAAIQRRLWLETDRVYRLRGLEFRSLNARSLKDITAASDQSFVVDFLDHNAPFAVMGGASFVSEASVVAPSVLVDDMELEPLPADYARPPIVPAPQLK